MPRVMVLAPYHRFYPPSNGGSLRCYYILRQLARAHEVHLVTLQGEDSLRQPAGPYTLPDSVRVYSPCQWPPPSTVFSRLPRKLGGAAHDRWLRRSLRGPANSFLLATHHLIRRVLTENKIDVALMDFDCLPAASLIRRLRPDVVRVLNAYNVEHLLLEQQLQAAGGDVRQRASLRRAYRLLRWHESHLDGLVDAFLTCSEHDRRLLESLNAGRLRGFTVPNGVDCSLRPYGEAPAAGGPREVLFCGSLDYPANRDGFGWFHAEIWPRVREQVPDARLTVVGGGSPGEDLAAAQGDPSVLFAGRVDDVVPHYRRAAVAIAPLRIGSGTRLKILESMSLGVPVVSTHLGAQGIDAEDGRHVLLGDTPHDFADAVCRLLGDVDTHERVRRAARALVERTYDWQVIGDRLDGILGGLLRRGSGMAEVCSPAGGACS